MYNNHTWSNIIRQQVPDLTESILAINDHYGFDLISVALPSNTWC